MNIDKIKMNGMIFKDLIKIFFMGIFEKKIEISRINERKINSKRLLIVTANIISKIEIRILIRGSIL
jgi:hypothetical protein